MNLRNYFMAFMSLTVLLISQVEGQQQFCTKFPDNETGNLFKKNYNLINTRNKGVLTLLYFTLR